MDPFDNEPEYRAAADRWRNLPEVGQPTIPHVQAGDDLHPSDVVSAITPAALPAVPGYEVLSVLGRGGMGVVYEARHLRLNRLVALKMTPADHGGDAAELVRFLTECETAAALEHPNIVHLYEVGQCDGRLYYTMELVAGGTLAARINGSPRPPRDAAELTETLARAVQFAHDHGIVHRDLKPTNVLLTPDGTPKVGDFGLAKRLALTGGLTQTGHPLGTPSYMAPEQIDSRSGTVGTAADVYGLGATLYELLTGRPPFQAPDRFAILDQVRTVDPVSPRRLQPGVPRDLETICLRCLRKEPRKRYATAADLADELRRYLDGKPILARPVGLVERGVMWARRNPGRAAALAAGLLVLVGAAVAAVAFRAANIATQREERAGQLVRALRAAQTAEVPRIVADLADVRDLARPGLTELAAESIDTKPGLHGRLAWLALLPDDPGRAEELVAYLPSCRADELLTIRKSLPPGEPTVAALWRVLGDDGAGPGRGVRAACTLAAFAPDDPRWAPLAPAVVEGTVRSAPVEFAVWADALEPVRGFLLPPLLARYPGAWQRIEAGKQQVGSGRADVSRLAAEVTELDQIAALLARYAADQPAELAEAALIVDARHHALLAPALASNREAVLPAFRAELAKPPIQDWGDGSVPPGPAIAAVGGVAGVFLDSQVKLVLVPRYGATAGVAGVPASLPVTDPDALHELRAKRRASAAAALFTLREPDAAWALLAHPGDDPSARSHLIARLAGIGADAGALVRRFEAERDVSAKRALLLAPGDHPPADREQFVARLLVAYRDHPDPGLHSAIDWLLRQQWGQAAAVAAIDAELRAAALARVVIGRTRLPWPAGVVLCAALGAVAGSERGSPRSWFVTAEGQSYAVVRGPAEFVMGSRPREPGRIGANEATHLKRINRTYAIATKEVTLGEFRDFNPDHFMYERDKTRPDVPVGYVSWYNAAAYCNFLSRREGIPEDQWCYEPNDRGEYAAGMRIKPGHLNLTGYRLPTDAEWEYAARAGSAVARHFGRSDELLPRYGRSRANSDAARGVAELRPNDLGLFDVLGNCAEWVEDPGQVSDGLSLEVPLVAKIINEDAFWRPNRWFPNEDAERMHYLEVRDAGSHEDRNLRVYRGGSFLVAPSTLRSAARPSFLPQNLNAGVGFRPVRTLEVHR